MKIIRATHTLVFAVLAMAGAQQVTANTGYTADTFLVRIGVSYVDPDEDSTNFVFDDLLAPGFFGAELDIDEEWGGNISAVWLPVEHWGLELMFTGGVNHDADLRRFRGLLPVTDKMHLGSFDVQMSDLFLNWYFLDPSCLGQPYVGIGVNYTDFHDEDLSSVASQYLIDNHGAIDFGSLGMGYSWGVAAQAGIDFMFGRDSQWLGNASIIYRDVDVDQINISFPVPDGGNRLIADFDYDPWTLNLGVGYKF